MKLSDITPRLQSFLPPNRVWAVGQVAVLITVVTHVALHLRLQSETADAYAHAQAVMTKPMRPVDRLAPPDEALLLELCPPIAEGGMQDLRLVNEVTRVVDRVGAKIVHADSEEPRPSENGIRTRRCSWTIEGPAVGLVQALSDIIRLQQPIRLQSFRWEAGEDSDARRLLLTVDLFYRPTSEED
ncbi:MAG: hypothetical protein AAF488_08780 [Planctomycetota bacterium]